MRPLKSPNLPLNPHVLPLPRAPSPVRQHFSVRVLPMSSDPFVPAVRAASEGCNGTVVEASRFMMRTRVAEWAAAVRSEDRPPDRCLEVKSEQPDGYAETWGTWGPAGTPDTQKGERRHLWNHRLDSSTLKPCWTVPWDVQEALHA